MSEQKLSDDELAEMERVCDELLPSRAADLFGDAMHELRALRAAALSFTLDERQALYDLRELTSAQQPWGDARDQMFALLDRLLAQGGGR